MTGQDDAGVTKMGNSGMGRDWCIAGMRERGRKSFRVHMEVREVEISIRRLRETGSRNFGKGGDGEMEAFGGEDAVGNVGGDFLARAKVGVEPREEDEFGEDVLGEGWAFAGARMAEEGRIGAERGGGCWRSRSERRNWRRGWRHGGPRAAAA